MTLLGYESPHFAVLAVTAARRVEALHAIAGRGARPHEHAVRWSALQDLAKLGHRGREIVLVVVGLERQRYDEFIAAVERQLRHQTVCAFRQRRYDPQRGGRVALLQEFEELDDACAISGQIGITQMPMAGDTDDDRQTPIGCKPWLVAIRPRSRMRPPQRGGGTGRAGTVKTVMEGPSGCARTDLQASQPCVQASGRPDLVRESGSSILLLAAADRH